MLKRPRLKKFLTVFPISDTTWGLRGSSDEVWRVKLRNELAMRAFCSLLPYLNGKLSVDEILEKLEEQGIRREPIHEILKYLESSRLIEEADSSGLSEPEVEHFHDQITFFSHFTSAGGSKYQAMLRDSRIGLLGAGNFSRSVFRQLAAAGFGKVVLLNPESEAPRWLNAKADDSSGTAQTQLTILALHDETIWPEDDSASLPQLLIVPQQAYDARLLEAVDAWSKRRHLPWLLLRAMDAEEGWVGPLFLPGETASYLSLEARLQGNLPFYSEHRAFDRYLRTSDQPSVPYGGLFTVFDLLSAIAVTEVIKFVTGIRAPSLAGRFLTVNFWDWESEIHEVLKVPGLDRTTTPRPATFPWTGIDRGDDL